MAGVPQNFQAISNVLPTYNSIDIASGTGIINFYAGDTVDLNLLSNSTFYAETVVTRITLNTGAVAKVLDVDYDVTLNRPLNIAGKVVLNVPIDLEDSGGGATTQMYVLAKVRKWDGVTETDICNNQSSNLSVTATGVFTYKMLAIDLNIPLTHFKIGEVLRLTLECWGNTSAGTHYGHLAHDPMSRTTGFDTSGAVPSRLTFQVPTRLNL